LLAPGVALRHHVRAMSSWAVNGRVVAASVAIHAALVVVLVLVGGGEQRRPAIDVEIVVPVTTEPPLPLPLPPVEPRRDPGGAPMRVVEPPTRPAPKTAKVPRPPRRPDPPPPPPPIVPPDLAPAVITTTVADVSTPTPPAETVTDGTPRDGGGDGLGGRGGGTGIGIGEGPGEGELDLSARPIPINASISQTLPYTAEAARDRISGDVQLLLTVDPLGQVGRVTVRRGLGHGLDEIATKLAMQIKFRPARDRQGQPTVGTVRWRFHFQPP
jgi:TonB family protein